MVVATLIISKKGKVFIISSQIIALHFELFFWVNDVRITIHYAHARFDSNTTERLEYTMRIYSPNYKYKCYARSKII